CDKTQTQIKVDYSLSGWNLEGSPSTGQVVLSSPHTQDNTRKKLLVLDSSTFSSGYLKVGSAKAYDPATGLTSSYFLYSFECPKVDLTNGGRLDIYADSKIVLFLSYTGGTFSDWSGVCELGLTPYDNKGWALIRDTGVCVAEAIDFNGKTWSWLPGSFQRFIGREPNLDGSTVEATKLLVSYSNLKVLSEIPSVYELPDSFGAIFDTIVFPDGKTYVICSNDGGTQERVAVPWG
ncbi:MAG: hypothetical protein DSY42_04900, partial [Aquifex sp.]